MNKPKISKKFLFLILIIFSCISCTLFPTEKKIKCNNLFLVYMAGDNSLNKTVYTDLEELKEGLQTENDIILVLADRYASNFYEDEWNEARLLEISYEYENLKIIELEDENIGVSLEWLDDSIDSGSRETFKSFLQYAQSHYDSEQIFLDIWNHGGGWKSGDSYSKEYQFSSRNICIDEQTNNSLSLKELSSAIKESKIKHFEIILMDACSMASIEVASELIDLTNTVIFSQDTIPEDGMPYNKIVPIIFSDKSTNEKCIQICNTYSNIYQNQKTTISAFRIDENNSMADFLLHFEKFMSSSLDLEPIRKDRPYYYEFLDEVIDMEIFSNEAFQEEYKKILITNISDYSNGLSIFFPEFFSYSKDSWEYNAKRLRFLEFCPSYIEFLLNIQQANSSNSVIDFYEPNNTRIDSYILKNTDKTIISYLWCINDEDWYSLKKTNDINKIQLINPDFLEYNLQIFLYKDNKLYETISADNQNEVDISSYDIDEIYIKIYSTFGYFSQDKSYTLVWS